MCNYKMNHLRHKTNLTQITSYYQNNPTTNNEEINVIVRIHRCYVQI